MIEIELRDKENVPFTADPHPQFIDFVLRETPARSPHTVVGIHHENLVAPVIAKLHGKTALATYADLMRARNEVVAAFPDREDGLRILELLLPWTQRFPNGRWVIAGAERVPKERFVAIASEPRFSARSLAIDPFIRDVAFIGPAGRMNDTTGIDLAPLETSEISIREAMRHNRANAGESGGSSSGRSRKRKVPPRGTGFVHDDGSVAKVVTATAVVRLDAVVHEAIALDPRAKELMAAVARALLSGTSYAAALEKIQQIGA